MRGKNGKRHVKNWRISTFNGALLAAYFIPAWTIVAFKIIVSPIQASTSGRTFRVALFLSDHLQVGGLARCGSPGCLALGKLTVVAFFAVFLVFSTRAAIRKSGGCDEALAMALGIGSLISFASMVMASRVGEIAAMRLHATELLLMLGAVIVMRSSRRAREAPARRRRARIRCVYTA